MSAVAVAFNFGTLDNVEDSDHGHDVTSLEGVSGIVIRPRTDVSHCLSSRIT
jgi:hypothetical protein